MVKPAHAQKWILCGSNNKLFHAGVTIPAATTLVSKKTMGRCAMIFRQGDTHASVRLPIFLAKIVKKAGAFSFPVFEILFCLILPWDQNFRLSHYLLAQSHRCDPGSPNNPCIEKDIHAKCTDTAGLGYTCTCSSAQYSGKNCEKSWCDPKSPNNPCINKDYKAICIDIDDGGYKCKCSSEQYSGKNCSKSWCVFHFFCYWQTRYCSLDNHQP